MSFVEVMSVFFFACTKQKANGKEESAIAFGYSYCWNFKFKRPGILALLPKLMLRRISKGVKTISTPFRQVIAGIEQVLKIEKLTALEIK